MKRFRPRQVIVCFTAILTAIVLAACTRWRTPPAPPSLIVGEFLDDYGGSHTVSATLWMQHPRNRFHITRWNGEGHYLIARNDSANASDGGLWTRIDWVELKNMSPYDVAFCFSAYKAPTAAEAESVKVAKPDSPRTGCNGFPFTRLKRSVRPSSTPSR